MNKDSAFRTSHSELRILILEDVPTDAELNEHELRKAGIEFASRRVDTRDDFIKGLAEFAPDIILADYKLPAFDGLSALEIAKEKRPDAPFIFVTGAMGEELAVETMRKGAKDYVLKDRLFKLAPAVKRALQEAEEHIKRREAENKLKEEFDIIKRMNKLMVGRELELGKRKEVIKKLEARVSELENQVREYKAKIKGED